MHTAWAADRSCKPLCHLETKTYLSLLKLGGMNPLTREWLSGTTACSEGAGKEGGVEALPSTSINGYPAKSFFLRNRHKQVESLQLRTGDGGNKGRLVVGVCSRPLDQRKPMTKSSCSSHGRHCTYRLLSCWETSVTPTSPEKLSD